MGSANHDQNHKGGKDNLVGHLKIDNRVREQLQRMGELQARVAAENSKLGKRRIIADYPDLRELLEQ